MKKIAVFVFLWGITLSVSAQKQAANWYFGEHAGLKFDLDTNSITTPLDGQLSTREGCASISDENGNLLFYTDGLTIWNKNHNVMSNGFGLFGDSSSTQSAIIVPKPENPDVFYVFTVDNFLDDINEGLNYSEVNMSLDSGLGAVTVKNVNLLNISSEKITAVIKDCLDGSIWVLTFASKDGLTDVYDTYHAFEVSNTGINTTAIKTTFGSGILDARGYLKLSPDGTKVASAHVTDGLFVYDFDASTGKLSNEINLSINRANNAAFPYGVEFSPDSNLLYVNSSNNFSDRDDWENHNNPSNHFAALTQFDFREALLQQSEITIDERESYRGALQLGPNGKIYRATSSSYNNGLSGLGVIEDPNEIGPSCNYRHNAVNLSPALSSQGLPPFIVSFFNTQIDIIKNGKSTINLDVCDQGSYTLESVNLPGATYIWTLDGNPLSHTNFDLEVTKAGHYKVYIDPNNGDCAIEGQAFVNFNPNPEAFDHLMFQCDEDGIVDGLTAFNLKEAENVLTGGETTSTAKFYLDPARTNEITDPENFSNTTNQQTIYVEVINVITSCTSNSELILDVSGTDSFDTEIAVCDEDGSDDGVHVFNLTDANSAIVNGLPPGLDISFFKTYDDALLEQNDLGDTYTNTTPMSQIIYARVENENNCYGISEVTLTVHPLADIEALSSEYYCTNFFPKPIAINAGLNSTNISDYTYSWSTGDNGYQIQVNAVGSYTVTVTDNVTGCSNVGTITVAPSSIATITSFKVDDATQNNSIVVFVEGDGTYQYQLIDNNKTIVAPFQDSNFFENVKPGFYEVAVRDIKNDCGTIKDNVAVIGFPKFFTPNNDGYNDTWQVYGISKEFQPETKISIYNRHGKLIKELSPLSEGWDGLFDGQRLPSDDYWFVVKLQDGRIYKNHFTLKY
ncbi:T9SS type B sorting domain-containing protein [Algibacter sp. 2305UL17-15]|uniref:T9SS type B sorting domain-containing protein n=1 Tax=Algibacter sp. 2305UL17-15 TaxID=3231268 RepID=UPI00345A702A